MGREGALNQFLIKVHIGVQPAGVDAFGFSTLSVRLAMIQLYILFMVTPASSLLGQVDRHAIEAARDLGGNWWSTFREVILPQTMPGIVIGSIFIFVLTMGEYGTVAGDRPGRRHHGRRRTSRRRSSASSTRRGRRRRCCSCSS